MTSYREMLQGLRETSHGFSIWPTWFAPECGPFVILDERLATLEPCGHPLPSPTPHPPVGSFTTCFFCMYSRRVGSKR